MSIVEDIPSKLSSLLDAGPSADNASFTTIDAAIALIDGQRKCPKIRQDVFDQVAEMLEFILKSENFLKTFLNSEDVFLRRASMKLLTQYATISNNNVFYDLVIDYEKLGCTSIDAFENVLRIFVNEENLPTNCLTSNSLILLFRKLNESMRGGHFGCEHLKRLFYVWKICLNVDSKQLRLEFANEFFRNWGTIYSQFFGKFLEILRPSDYNTNIELLNVCNCLLTTNLENFVFQQSDKFFDDTNTTEVAKFILNFFTKNDQIFSSSNKPRWFGGVDETSALNFDPCLRRLFILIVLKSSLLSKVEKKVLTFEEINSKIVVDLFLDQDDQLCELFLCNLLLNNKQLWNDHEIMISFLNSINWNYDVMLDWIISQETLFLAYFLRYLKKSIIDIESLMTFLKSFEFVENPNELSSNKSSEICSNYSSLTLSVTEIIGDVEKTKEITIHQLLPSTSSTNYPGINEKRQKIVDVTSDFVGCFSNLKNKLTKVQQKNLTPFNVTPLLNSLTNLLSKLPSS